MIPANQLADMTVMAEPPAKMWKALAVIAQVLHPAYDARTGLAGGSKDKCLFVSLAIRDFLVEIGYRDATVRGCAFVIRADDLDGNDIWSVGIGVPGQTEIDGKFNGHAVCIVPSLGFMIDATLYQAIRPHWSGALTGMVALPYHSPWRHQMIQGRPAIAGVEVIRDDRRVMLFWLDRPELQWRKSEDYRIKSERRRYVTKALREAFGEWKE